jgi:excinuclease ABC subunit A
MPSVPNQPRSSRAILAAPSQLRIRGARAHNLRDISLDIPHTSLTVITGVSGSGKSSLAFDTIYAEGQRQYIESLSTYARQFLHQLPRPDVDSLEGLQPTLCIDQRGGTASPRSTVGTVTEVYDYLRLLMARTATPHCFECGQPIHQQSTEQIVNAIAGLPEGSKLVLLAPVVRGRRGAHRDALSAIQKAGLVRVRVDGELYEIESVPALAPRKNHSIEAVVDKIVIRPDNLQRLSESVSIALKLTEGVVAISYLTPQSADSDGHNQWQERLFSTQYSCAACGASFAELEPRTFSFNSPYGACPACSGVGTQTDFDPESIVADWELSAAQGAFAFLKGAPRSLATRLRRRLQPLLADFGLEWTSKLSSISGSLRNRLLLGSDSDVSVLSLLNELYTDSEKAHGKKSDGKKSDGKESDGKKSDLEWLDQFRSVQPCAACKGSRLRPEALSVMLCDRSIAEICQMNIGHLLVWLENLQLDPTSMTIARPILVEMLHRLRFLKKVGLEYLSLDRPADSLSGGELQRVRLATSIGTGLVGVCYILDEPSIGLHQRDNERLIGSLRDLQQQGNTVLVVEHDEAMMRAADMLVDMGPGAGNLGGHIVAIGLPDEVIACQESITAAYLRGDRQIGEQRPARPVDPSRLIQLKGARLHNLQDVSVELPLGLLVGITGVSGSGKSSLIGQTLVPAIQKHLYPSSGVRPGPYRQLTGLEHVDKLIQLTQSPIGRTPRSTPATYCGVFDLIRQVFAGTREAKSRGFSSSRFSFNAGTGRCSLCQGQGQEKIEMNFLPDLYVCCSVCNGARYNRQTLQIRYREKTIADVLEMSIDEAAEFFANFQKILQLLSALQQVGLGYLCLGQSSNTLSGGEAQRIKLATELARPDTGGTIYFLDEPTTGLHFEDIQRLVSVLNGLVDRGNTVIVIEHNVDVIRNCDWLIDLGPEGGENGGRIVATGTPQQLTGIPQSITGAFLKPTAAN